jgi:hypothetical protein
VQSAKNLRVTAHARALASEVYRVTATFPVSERYGLVTQMRRAAVSTEEEFVLLVDTTVRLKRMLSALIKALRKSLHETPPRP